MDYLVWQGEIVTHMPRDAERRSADVHNQGLDVFAHLSIA